MLFVEIGYVIDMVSRGYIGRKRYGPLWTGIYVAQGYGGLYASKLMEAPVTSGHLWKAGTVE